jgi:hypothetical protein
MFRARKIKLLILKGIFIFLLSHSQSYVRKIDSKKEKISKRKRIFQKLLNSNLY